MSVTDSSETHATAATNAAPNTPSSSASVSAGPDVRILARIALGRDIHELAGKELRLQLTTYNPGARNKPHTHEGKVEVVYALAGNVTEHHADGRVEAYRPGDAFTANRDTHHHMQNDGSEPVQLVVAMIVDAPPR